VFAVGLLACTLSLAYFQSKDEVTNKVSAKDVEIVLLEPNWSKSGMTEALLAEPGVTIPKDPQVYNKSDDSVYVRMKFDIVDSAGKSITGDRYNAILSQIFITSVDSENVTTNSPFATITADGITYNNANFVYADDGWFYYIDSNTEDSEETEDKDDNTENTEDDTETDYAALAAGATTPKLFDCVEIPVLKSEYNGVFDSAFSIKVTAQAIPVDENLTTNAKIKTAFKDKFGS
jgi:hypothetical protein